VTLPVFRIGQSFSWEFSRKYLTSHSHFSPQWEKSLGQSM
jgi:hypothetical protein